MKIPITILMAVVLVGAVLVSVGCRRSSGGAKEKRQFSDAESARHAAAKEKALERVLGPMHKGVGHAVIPFQVGGAADMYYFPNGIPGTGFATMELVED